MLPNPLLSARIKTLVEKFAHGSEKVFADRIGATQQGVNNWIRGATGVSSRRIRDICTALQVREQWLTRGIEPMEEPKDYQNVSILFAFLQEKFKNLEREIQDCKKKIEHIEQQGRNNQGAKGNDGKDDSLTGALG